MSVQPQTMVGRPVPIPVPSPGFINKDSSEDFIVDSDQQMPQVDYQGVPHGFHQQPDYGEQMDYYGQE